MLCFTDVHVSWRKFWISTLYQTISLQTLLWGLNYLEKYILYTELFSLICKRFHQFIIRQTSEKKTLFLTNTVILKWILIFPVLNLSAYNEGERGVKKTGANMSVYIYTVYGNGTNWQPNKKHVLYIWQYIAIQQLMLSTEYLSFVLDAWRIVKKNLLIVTFSSTKTREVRCLWNWRREGLPFPWSTKARYRNICFIINI